MCQGRCFQNAHQSIAAKWVRVPIEVDVSLLIYPTKGLRDRV
jgi:hypothetical protein